MIKVPAQFPSGETTKIAFIGEAPSDEELEKGQPLVGPSGRVFNAMLRSANLDRSEYLIDNVWDEMLPGSGDTEIAKARAEWLKDEGRFAESVARLNEELARFRPNVVVPLGATAMWAFTGINSITNFRGAVTKSTRIAEGMKLVPTYHPSAVRRNWQLLPIGVKDFEKAAAEADLGPKIIYPKVEIFVEPTLQDVRQFVAEAQASGKLSVDIETGWGQITSIAFAPTTSRAFEIPIVDLRKPNKSYWPTARDERDVWLAIRDILEYPNPKVGQNYMYDLFWLYMQKGIATRNYRYDTRLRHKVLFPELPADLANMGATYTRIGAWKSWGGRYQKDVEKKDG